jgi:hypothetical protein
MGVGGSRQQRMTDDTDAKIYPTTAWRIAIGDTKVCLVEIQYARDMAELHIGAAGGELPSVPLGMTEEQCRELAADLMEAAHRLKGGKGWGRPKPN